MIRICIIGVTGFGQVHYSELITHHAAGLSQLVAATIINPDEVPDRCAHLTSIGCQIHSDFREMLAQWSDKADLCIVPTGIHWHAPMAIAAMEAGMDVLLEKPAAATLADIDAMQATERRTGRRVIMGFQAMYALETLPMKRAVLDGSLGHIREIVSWSLWPRDPSYYARNAWAGRVQVNGTPVLDSPFNNAVAHQLHMILFLAGANETSSATVTQVRAELYRAKPIESCDTAAIAITTAEDIPCRFVTSHAGRNTVNPIIEVRGELATLRWDYHKNVTIRHHDGRVDSLPVDTQVNSRTRMHAAVREALSGGNAFLARLTHARAHTQVVNLAHAAGPIHTIQQAVDGHLDGIEDVVQQCADRVGGTFGDCGAAWAVAPAQRDALPDPTVSELLASAATAI
jgi:predicted dehydrogenase